MFLRPMLGSSTRRRGAFTAEYWPIAAALGRTASSNPNTQQIPREREVRECFTAAERRVLVITDHSQVELRIATAWEPPGSRTTPQTATASR